VDSGAPLPGAAHGLIAARIWELCANWPPAARSSWQTWDMPTSASMSMFPTGTGQGPSQKDVNRAHAQLRSPGKRAMLG